MSNILKLDFRRFSPRPQSGSSVLGLCWDGGRLDGVALRRTNGSVVVNKVFSVSLSLDPLTNAPELVGREIRNRLDEQGVRERRCVLAIPLKWILTAHTAIPELPEEDIPTFLQTEAERGFPCDVATLVTATSRYATPDGKQYATFIGVPRNHVGVMDRVLRAALLRPVSFALGLAALQPPAVAGSKGVLAFSIGETSVGLQVTCGGGLAALRTLESTIEVQGSQRVLHADVVARETRITLGQMPPELRDAVRKVRIFGPPEMAQQLADELELRLESMGLDIEPVQSYGADELGVHAPEGMLPTQAFSVAARFLAGQPTPFEFLPPRVSQWQQFAARYSSGKLQQIGLAVGLVAGLVALVFLYQQWQLMRLQRDWTAIKTRVTDLRELQRKTAQFKPWYDESFHGLTILKRLTEAFPEDGSVTAKTVEIRDPGIVTCNGVARDYQALLKTVERLRAIPERPDVNLGQTRGTSPNLQFTLNFVWNNGGSSAN